MSTGFRKRGGESVRDLMSSGVYMSGKPVIGFARFSIRSRNAIPSRPSPTPWDGKYPLRQIWPNHIRPLAAECGSERNRLPRHELCHFAAPPSYTRPLAELCNAKRLVAALSERCLKLG
jgi:hypothetical protein